MGKNVLGGHWAVDRLAMEGQCRQLKKESKMMYE